MMHREEMAHGLTYSERTCRYGAAHLRCTHVTKMIAVRAAYCMQRGHACVRLHCYPVDSCHCLRWLFPTHSGLMNLLLHVQKFCQQRGHLAMLCRPPEKRFASMRIDVGCRMLPTMLPPASRICCTPRPYG